jgi:DNA repair protein RecO (recombination protein O)
MLFGETEAVVISTIDYGESDRLVTFFTRLDGKLKGIAKGARRSRKRFVHAFEPGSLVELSYRKRKSLVWIETCRLLDPHLALRTEIDRWGYSALISEILVELTPEGEAQEELFFLYKEVLNQLTDTKDLQNVVILYLIKFLSLTGYLPALDNCSICNEPIEKNSRWWWHIHEGRLLCHKHPHASRGCFVLDLGVLRLIRQIRLAPLDRMWRLRLRRNGKEPLLDALLEWVHGQINRKLKSLNLLGQVDEYKSPGLRGNI